MDAAVGNLADAGDDAALDRQRIRQASLPARRRRGAGLGPRHRAREPGEARARAGLIVAGADVAGEHLRLLAIDQSAVGFAEGEAVELLRAAALRRPRSRRARPGAGAAPRGCRSGPGAPAPIGGAGGRCAAPRRAAPRCARRISGRAAASRERTWTASRTEPGWTRASAAGRRVIVSSAAVSRTIGPWRSARRARCSAWKAAIRRDAALGRGEIGLGRLDPRRQRRARRAGAVGLADRAARLADRAPDNAASPRPPRAALRRAPAASLPRDACAAPAIGEGDGDHREGARRACQPHPSR